MRITSPACAEIFGATDFHLSELELRLPMT
jgi:hypothetical protein